MNIVICDDNEIDALTAKKIISRIFREMHIGADIDYYLVPSEVKEKLLKKNEPLDILILDIDMPQVSGLELAKELRHNNLNLIIIFLSAHEEFVFKAIEFQPFRYIRKMRMESEMPIAIQSAVRVIEANRDKQIILNTDNGEMKIMISEIMYYETEKRKISVHLKNGHNIIVNRKITEMQELINKDSFIMIHRSCVVNSDYVKNILNGIVVLDNDEKLIVSRPRYKDIKRQILKLWGELL